MEKSIKPDLFYPCLHEFFDLNGGNFNSKDIIWSEERDPSVRRILGYHMTIQVKGVDKVPIQGPQYLEDIRRIEASYGPPGTFSYSIEYLDFEQYVVFEKETIISLLLAGISTAFVLLVVTFSWRASLILIINITLVLVYVSATIHYWDLTFNSIVVVNIMVTMAFAQDFSVHIVNTYLVTVPPKGKQFRTEESKRVYKTKTALSRMGSGLIHGGFATFLAICCLFLSKSYIYSIFYKLWSAIVLFSVFNGFIFIPVMLSLFGPVDSDDRKSETESPAKPTKTVVDSRASEDIISPTNPVKTSKTSK